MSDEARRAANSRVSVRGDIVDQMLGPRDALLIRSRKALIDLLDNPESTAALLEARSLVDALKGWAK